MSTTSSGSSSGVSRATAAAACGKFHYSLFEFAATETTMLSVARGQVLRVIQVSFISFMSRSGGFESTVFAFS